MSLIKYGVVGVGYFGAGLARILQSLEGAKVVAVYDPENAEKIANELQCDVCLSAEELCQREDVDAVIVASPNGMHKEAVLLAAENKKNVFCEKPIALNIDDCNKMIEKTKEANVLFMAGHIMNFMRGVREAKQLINDGVIGDVVFCHAERNGWEEPQETVSWKKIHEISGGHLYHHIHELDFVQFLMGPAERVTMTGGNVVHSGKGYGNEDDMLFISLEFSGNRFATLQYGSAFRWGSHFVRIQGTKGAILIDLQDTKVVLKTATEEKQLILHESKEEDDDRTRWYKEAEIDEGNLYGNPTKNPPKWLFSIMEKEMKFLHSILQGKEVDAEFIPLVDGTAARDSIATADALTLSLKEDRKVSVGELLK